MTEEATAYNTLAEQRDRASEVETKRQADMTDTPWYETTIMRLRADRHRAWQEHGATLHRETATWHELYRLFDEMDLPPMTLGEMQCNNALDFLLVLEKRIEKRLGEEGKG